MDADQAEVIWMFDAAAEPDGPVMCAIDELAGLVGQALASAGCTEVGIVGLVSQLELEGAAIVRFVLVADVGGSGASCRVVAGVVDASGVRSGARVRAWGRLRLDTSGGLELAARDVHLLTGWR